jgi:hypothetical protein
LKDFTGEKIVSEGGLTRLKKRIEAKKALGWNFIFLGASPEAWSGHSSFGSTFNVSAGNTYKNQDRHLVGAAMRATSSSMASYKAAGAVFTEDFYGGEEKGAPMDVPAKKRKPRSPKP